MKRMNRLMTKLYVRATSAWTGFQRNERGDTNFISILIILAIAVILAGLFWVLGKGVMETVTQGVKNFFSDLGMTWKEG